MFKKLLNKIFGGSSVGYNPPPVEHLDMTKAKVPTQARMGQMISQLDAFVRVDEELINAIQSGDIELAKKLTERRNALPCPICRRNQR